MTDRANVVEHLYDCLSASRPENMWVFVRKSIVGDAVALLQKTVDKNSGEWNNGHCSCCGKDVSSMLDTWTNVQSFLYCPNCGAKMEE